MAGLWKLPMIYMIENNLYGMGTSVERASHQQKLYAKFRGFPGIKIDGMDVFTLREHLKVVKDYAIKNGPIFVEVDTYRYFGHSMSDPGITYRVRQEVSDVREHRDPILKVKKHILEHSIATEADLKNIEKETKAQVEKDVEQAKRDPFPDVKDMYAHVYHANEEHFIRGVEYNQSQFPKNV
jgi:pyruvate dehydrogenase E1 component alpha subunit